MPPAAPSRFRNRSAERRGLMISIIVPAHNESAVIQRSLSALVDGAGPGELEVIVATNGCTDDTAQIAAGFGPPVRVVSVSRASKPAALNAGDAAARGFPRLYVDADVELDTASVRVIAAALREGYLAASPELFVDTSASSPLVRSYYRFWSELPSVAEDLVGRGVYAVSAAGRQRFASFPDVLNDDHFFRELFAASERVVARGSRSRVWAPRTTKMLVNRKTRVQVGNRMSGRGGNARAGIAAVLRNNPTRLFDLPAFLVVGMLARARARRISDADGSVDWGRDDSRPVLP